MKTKYAFNLGRVFTLSLAEIFAVFEQMEISFRLVDLYREVLIIETETELAVDKLQRRLGGTIKIMQVLDSLGRKKDAGPSFVFHEYFDIKLLKEKFLPPRTSKLVIGISIYPMARGLPLRGENKRLGFMIKEVLRQGGCPARIVWPQNDSISLASVVVVNEHLLEKGAEIDFLVGLERIYLARTLTVQDFEDYGRRDYQRPARDQQVGMLPPKVAQEMINLAQIPKTAVANPKAAVLDPFVGSGTILQEAMIMGYKTVGSDISEKAIDGAQKNLEWIKNRYKVPPGRFELFVSDAAELAANLPRLGYEAVVTEGTLGPAYTQPPKDKEIEANFKELGAIYLGAFKALLAILPSGKRVVIALPAYHIAGHYRFFEIIDSVEKLGYTIVDPIPPVVTEKYDFLLLTPRRSIIYDRKDQFVSREIFILKKN